MACEAWAVLQWDVWLSSYAISPQPASGHGSLEAVCLHVTVCLPHAQSAACQQQLMQGRAVLLPQSPGSAVPGAGLSATAVHYVSMSVATGVVACMFWLAA